MMENHTIDELEQMRLQMSQLKDALENQRIITDRILRRAMVNRSSWLGNFVRIQMWAMPFLFLLLAAPCILMGMSWYPVIVWGVLCAVSIWLDFRTVNISKEKILNLSFTELRIFLVRQKRQRNIQALTETAIMLPWLVWFFYEFFRSTATEQYPFRMEDVMVTFGIAAFIGVIVTLLIYRKINKTSAALIDEINAETNTHPRN